MSNDGALREFQLAVYDLRNEVASLSRQHEGNAEWQKSTNGKLSNLDARVAVLEQTINEMNDRLKAVLAYLPQPEE